METGKVKWFDEKKGFGFITLDSGKDAFVHYSGIDMTGFKTLQEGQPVSLRVEQSDRGLKAVDVKPI
jgi:CspA family cold shock protein